MHEQRAARVVDLVALADVDVLQRTEDVEHPSHVHVEPDCTKQPAEDEQIVGEVGHQRPATWARMPASRSPRMASISSFALRRTPSVCSTAAASRAWRSSATSARAQSIVSETPGTLYSSRPRRPWTNAVTWSARRAGASGTRSRTIARSLSKDGYSIH